MNRLDVFRRKSGALQIANLGEIVSRYKRMRTVGRKLNHEMVERLSKDVLHEGAKKLGILQRGVLVFNSEDESAVLMDYCLYDVRRKGRNSIEQYLIEFPPDEESDEMTSLRAMQHSIYSMFVVESVERGLGLTARDLLSNESALVVDMGLSQTAQPGLLFASRLLFHDGFSMTGGAALPIGVLPKEQRNSFGKNFSDATTRDDDGYFDPAPLIRKCLSGGCSSQVEYQETMEQATGQQQLSNNRRSTKIGRNAPCPCGSGKKFKQCCMKRP